VKFHANFDEIAYSFQGRLLCYLFLINKAGFPVVENIPENRICRKKKYSVAAYYSNLLRA
jgi:hypothetical protein